MRKRFLPLVTIVLCAGFPAYAQPIESEPLAPIEIKPVEARPLDNVPQEDTPAAMDSAPLVQPETLQATNPIPSALPYGSRMGTAPPEQLPENRKFCSLKVSFGSIGTGIDSRTADQVKSYLDTNAGTLTYLRADQGKEGEFSYCIDIADHKNRSKTYTALKKILLDKPGKAPVTLAGAGFTPLTNTKAVEEQR